MLVDSLQLDPIKDGDQWIASLMRKNNSLGEHCRLHAVRYLDTYIYAAHVGKQYAYVYRRSQEMHMRQLLQLRSLLAVVHVILALLVARCLASRHLPSWIKTHACCLLCPQHCV